MAHETSARNQKLSRKNRNQFLLHCQLHRDDRPLAFYTTEDAKRGPLTKFTPDDQSQGPHKAGKGIRGTGSYEYLVLENDGNGGEFWFASDRNDANAEDAYPSAEGIDIRDGTLYFVSKRRKLLYILDLDRGRTTEPHSTISARPSRRSRTRNGSRGACSVARTRSQGRLGMICEKREPRSAPARRRRTNWTKSRMRNDSE